MRTTQVLTVAAALAGALALGACGTTEPATGTTDGFGAGPSPSVEPSPILIIDPTEPVSPKPPTPPKPPVVKPPIAPPPPPPPPAPDYPTTARAYAEAVVEAWQDDDVEWLGDLATAGVQEQIIEIPPLNMDWAYQRCDGTAGSSYCAFVNDIGDVLTLRISHSRLGLAHAATEVRLDGRA